MIKIRHTSDKDYFQFWGVYIQQNVLPFTDDHKVTVLWKRSASPGKGRWPHINVEILCRSLNEKIYQNHWNFQISYSNQYAKYHIWPYSTTQTKSNGIFFTCLAIPLPATSTSMLTFSDLECELVVHTICVSVTVFTSQAVPDIVTVTSDFTELKNN